MDGKTVRGSRDGANPAVHLVSAFAGREKTLELYKLAVEEKYRFFSFGDAMIIL